MRHDRCCAARAAQAEPVGIYRQTVMRRLTHRDCANKANPYPSPPATPLMSPEIYGEAIAKAKQIITPQKSAS
jgi:hypothetical protein